MSLIEKIARAIHDGLGDGWAYTSYGGDEWNDCRDMLDRAAQAALTAIMGEGDGVQQCDREAAADLYLDQIGDEDGFADRIRANTAQPGCDAWEQAFARHRSTAAAAERARIVASLRDTPWPYRNDALADAIERGEV